MRAFRLDNSTATLHQATLAEQGIFYQKLSADDAARQQELELIKQQHGYLAQDIVELRPDTPDLETLCAKFDKEHLHSDDEVRLILSGEGIFDIRDLNDEWLRLIVEANDLLIVPARRHHRFMLTEKKRIQTLRLFKNTDGWTAIYRATAANV